jgi:DHA1 family tetracycline resistance protein-like MFS transporter
MILACFLLSCIPALVFFVTIHVPTVDPFWFYVSNSLLGAINYMSITFAALSDVVPDNYRAPAYGFLLAGFYAGFALSPSLPLCLTAEHVAALSFGLILATLLIATIVLPETLPDQIRQENMAAREQSRQETASVSSSSSSFAAWTWAAVTRPVREVAILNRDWLIRLVAAGSFFSSAVFASDATLVLYYIEDQLNVRETDLARMFFLMGIFGVVLQGGFLQPMLQCFGEKGLLVATFCSGILHNFLYGVATNKTTLCVAMLLSQLTKMNFPLLSSLASKDASTNEQGRVQGALFATNAIAYAVGPLSMEYVYHRTKNKKHFGPGFMFVYAAGLYAIGTLLVALIPIKKSPEVSSSEEQQPGICGATEDLEEPLLSSDGEVNGETEGPCLTETIE